MEYVARIAIFLMISVPVRALSDSSYCPGVLNHSVVNLVDGWVSQRCHLHTYRIAEVTKCLNLLLLHPPDYARKLSHGKLHIAFVGDSRIRYLFNNFIQLLPDYDLQRSGFVQRIKMHEDATVDSSIFNFRISFFWRPLLNGALDDLLRLWSTSPYSETPTLILIGISFWHMFRGMAPNPWDFQQNLTNIVPRIKELTRKTVLLWTSQHPLANSDYEDVVQYVTTEKISFYNSISRRILRDSGAIFWDSSDLIAAESVRGCSLNYRQDRTAYENCDDDLHTGYSALFRANEILLNFLCNRYLTLYDSVLAGVCCN